MFSADKNFAVQEVRAGFHQHGKHGPLLVGVNDIVLTPSVIATATEAGIAVERRSSLAIFISPIQWTKPPGMIGRLLTKVYKRNLPLALMGFSSLFSGFSLDYLQQFLGGKPVFEIVGQIQTGKSSMWNLFEKMLGLKDQICTHDCTVSGLLNNIFPVCFPHLMKKKQTWLFRALWFWTTSMFLC